MGELRMNGVRRPDEIGSRGSAAASGKPAIPQLPRPLLLTMYGITVALCSWHTQQWEEIHNARRMLVLSPDPWWMKLINRVGSAFYRA